MQLYKLFPHTSVIFSLGGHVGAKASTDFLSLCPLRCDPRKVSDSSDADLISLATQLRARLSVVMKRDHFCLELEFGAPLE